MTLSRHSTVRNPQAAELFTEWDDILTRPVEAIVTAMLDPSLRARDLRSPRDAPN